MSENKNKQTDNLQHDEYALDDARRLKVLSPGMLVLRRFMRNRLAIVGVVILVLMFLFSFLGGYLMPYGQDQTFRKTITSTR